MTIHIKQMPAFKKTYKKLHAHEKAKVNEAIRLIVQNPKLGEEKKGDLSGIFIYKFKMKKENLLAYEWNTRNRLLIALGVHEFLS